jgi:N-sulfoglucosamine sulfohydrolase
MNGASWFASRMRSRLLNQLLFSVILAAGIHAVERPNILWITAEDMSATLGCYGDKYATTPNIDAFARQSVRYTQAFATAPVCSPSRSCLITGCYAPSLGTQQMRSAFPIPERMKGFPSLLRREGYYTSNNVKTDYNNANWEKIIRASWNESSPAAHFNRRKDKEQSFFSIFNLMTSHQSRSMVWPYERFQTDVQSKLSPGEIHDPKLAPLPPYYPDTPVVRKTVARFYDCVTAMDKEVGQILQQLEDDGKADNTIVFFYSDHGSGMPRHKRALLDSGMHVPLMIRFPEKYAHLAPGKPGTTTDRLVSFVDYAPTVLSLLNLPIPAEMQGSPFLGEAQLPAREHVFGHRDRVDEVRDLARSVRDKQFLLIRNFMPHLGYNQFTAWPDLGEIRHEFYAAAKNAKTAKASGPLAHFLSPRRPPVELYDCVKDPQNLKNLADDPKYQEVIWRMNSRLRRHLREIRDVGFFPESDAWEISTGSNLWDTARTRNLRLEDLVSAATKVGSADEAIFVEELESWNPAVRYWGAIGLAAVEGISAKGKRALQNGLKDGSAAVRIECAGVLVRSGDAKDALRVLTRELKNENFTVVLHAARTIELLGVRAKPAIRAMERLVKRCYAIRPADTPPTVVASGREDLAMFTAMSANGFLSRVK